MLMRNCGVLFASSSSDSACVSQNRQLNGPGVALCERLGNGRKCQFITPMPDGTSDLSGDDLIPLLSFLRTQGLNESCASNV
jgi:hypothetical protein